MPRKAAPLSSRAELRAFSAKKTIAALDATTDKYRHHGKDVKIVGLNDASVLVRERLAGKLGAGH